MARDKSQEEDYNYHNPVLRDLTIEMLINNREGVYVDGTLGGGGHTAAILQSLAPGGKVLAFDKDPTAIEHCKDLFAEEEGRGRLEIINDCFSNACSYTDKHGKFDGLLLDLGVSSKQLDSNSIGLSYRVNSDLDMRFSPVGAGAKELLNTADEDKLITVLRQYGEEPNARAIVRRLMQRRRLSSLHTTFDLRAVVEEVTPEKFRTKALSRVFQAIRIAVNDEMGVLEKALRDGIPSLKTGGRIVVMSYHSLEDRVTKSIFKEFKGNEPGKLNILTKKPIEADEEEIKKNPRARSVKIRVGEMI
jgi:16S rRNA (cytosine1402-N4)-methyltransferase